jgi:hypothetical protein
MNAPIFFSFAVVLYELLANRRPFQAATNLQTLHTIIEQEPEPLGEDVPVPLRMIVEKALEKDPQERYQSMRDLVVDLRRAMRKPVEVRSSAASARRWNLNWIAVAAVVLVAGVAGGLLTQRFARPQPVQNVQVQRLTDLVGLEEMPAISPDGKTVAFVATSGERRRLWVRLLAGGTPLAVTDDDMDHYGPRWSPDSGILIYFTPGPQPGEAGTLFEVPALGGPARRVAGALGPGDISHDGKNIAFFRFQDGSNELAITARDQSGMRTLTKLPNAVYSNPLAVTRMSG